MRIGILGAGQLARMMTLSAAPLGLDITCIDPADEACAARLCTVTQAPYEPSATLEQWLSDCDVITFENENIPIDTLHFIEQRKPIYPSIKLLEESQDRLLEKQAINALGIGTAPFAVIDSLDDLHQAAKTLGFPFLIKTRRFGYDGKGQHKVESEQELARVWSSIEGTPCIAEGMVSFERELSLIAVRSQAESKYYPLIENVHRDGILRQSDAPYLDASLQSQAEDIARKIQDHYQYIGVMTIELFHTKAGLIINEIAPRVHNSGHWTIEGADTSQFENHLRAVCGLPLGSTAAKGHSTLFNCLGSMPAREQVLAIAKAHLHDYQKSPKPLRKVGHVTLNGRDKTSLKTRELNLLCEGE